MKKLYTKPDFDLEVFQRVDVLTDSEEGTTDDGNGLHDGDEYGFPT
ncbi:MAG: hypothetical protein IJ168_08695 [Eubacterium sp.]|nr:hypothetical protein [Eubacterium sp.]